MSDLIDARAFGSLEAKVKNLEDKVSEQSMKIDLLLKLANEGKGSLRILLIAAGTVGGVVTWLADHFVLK